ncbi:hypothetical protein GBAR_LOCUS7120 [Geodia barretti]|uniref:Uncharacterized protein n=1 Tax=Geodia barretti TaxID=519541 RepID=A0AA35RG79_GEOBA|nr:hypothetical protein GBAR_LOCUS7120 [Geodia barretti]
MFLSWLALLFSILGAVTAVDICSDYPKPDPCLPGGEWDPVLNSCSGYDGRSCFQCYSGQFCKTREDTLTCQLSSTGGNPLVIAQFWLLNSTQEPCSTTLAHYRPAYQNPPGVPLPPLEDAIRKLHAIVRVVYLGCLVALAPHYTLNFLVPKCRHKREATDRRIWSNHDASCNCGSPVRNDPQGMSLLGQ